MIDHDQFFKKLLTRFFDDFVRIVAPEVAAELQLDDVTFLETEGFTDFRDGRRRLLDLVAQVETRSGEPEIVLVHVEIEGRARSTMEMRMWRYAMQLRLRHHRPVIPIVLYLRGGPPGVSARTVEERFGGLFLGSFGYLAFGLSRGDAQRYLERPEPLAWGLAALMRRGDLRPVRKKLTSLHRIASDEGLDDLGRLLLMECVETYVQLNDAEEEAFRSLLAGEVNREVATMEMTWPERLRQEGRQEGRREGEQKGFLKGMQTLLLDMLRQRFGAVQPETESESERSTRPRSCPASSARSWPAASRPSSVFEARPLLTLTDLRSASGRWRGCCRLMSEIDSSYCEFATRFPAGAPPPPRPRRSSAAS